MTKKNSVIRPSLIQWCRSSLIACPPRLIVRFVAQRSWYDADHGELAQISAITAAPASSRPPDASMWRNWVSGRAMDRAMNRSLRSQVGRSVPGAIAASS